MKKLCEIRMTFNEIRDRLIELGDIPECATIKLEFAKPHQRAAVAYEPRQLRTNDVFVMQWNEIDGIPTKYSKHIHKIKSDMQEHILQESDIISATSVIEVPLFS